jgi:hypothetical protein
MPKRILLMVLLAFAGPVAAQDSETSGAATAEETPAEALLTQEELQTLVAPVALYPDTLLIQILVAATQPLEIVKAERFLLDNADRDPTDLQPEIEAMGWDPSVAVLAEAFPQVIGEMATHIDWTETTGTAMLAQSDDVLSAVQVMRDAAINTGALVSGPEQTVEVDEEEAVVITPTTPEVVYVPQYDTTQVYNTGPSTGDIIGGVLITYGVIALIDQIFDNDDDWYGYWGCRNCGGWNNRPIIRNPDIDIDIDGNVNIGNRIDINRDNVNIGDRGDIGWTPDPDRSKDAKNKIANHKSAGAAQGRLPVERPQGRTDELRNKLSSKTGAADIARDATARDRSIGAGAGIAAGGVLANPNFGENAPNRKPQIDRGGVAADKAAAKRDAVAKTRDKPAIAAPRPQVKAKPQIAKKPQISRPKASVSKGQGLKKASSGPKARSSASRGKVSRGKGRR